MIQCPAEGDALLSSDDIAIVGIGCRFPGGADCPAAFWELLCSGGDAIREVPSDRWPINRYYSSFETPGTAQTRWGGFIEHIDLFDPSFFGISPREAIHIDPQQRLLLETTWEAFEDAAQDTAALSGSLTGVFIGISTGEYWDLQLSPTNRSRIDAYTNLGGSMSIAANRISYVFNLRGPSLAVDTACSSSLVAIHLARNALRNGECDVAVVGGVNAILKPEVTIGFSKAHMLSPDGRCKAFDSAANGYVRGEGAGVVILKPLRRAVRDNDRVYAVIKGCAVNQDGTSDGITVPSADAQRAMLEMAYRSAGVDPGKVQYVEAHGTGTAVGDPIEANAIGAVLSTGRINGDVCYIGSVKTNIGHLESAAGIAGLIKTALAIHHRKIPANLNFKRPNPQIDFEALRLTVPIKEIPWPQAREAVAGVNSFGFGGTNAHVVLGEAPQVQKSHIGDQSEVQLVLISAKTVDALKLRTQKFVDFLAKCQDNSLTNIAYSSSARATSHEKRIAIIARSRCELSKGLRLYLAGATQKSVITGHCERACRPKLVFVFTGMGPQWWGMGRELLQKEPTYAEMIDRCDTLLRSYTTWSLLEELQAEKSCSRMNQTSVSQPANFALQVGLSALLKDWGIEPDYIVGHSTGEVAAAWNAGILSLEDATRVIFYRSFLQQRLAGAGRMAAVGIAEDEASAKVVPWRDRISIAAINSPSSVTLSGEEVALEEIARTFAANQVFFRFLQVNIPFHSKQMDPLRDDLIAGLQSIRSRPPRVPIFSTVTGEAAGRESFNAFYWWANVRETVLFAKAVDGLIDRDATVFLEIGPHPVLSNSILECAKARGRTVTAISSLRRDESDRESLLRTLGQLWIKGARPHWRALFKNTPSVVGIPSHPWQRDRYWDESPDSALDRLSPDAHPLLGARVQGPLPRWERELANSHPGYLDDHRVRGNVVFPAAGYLEMALAAAMEIYPEHLPVLKNVKIQKALVLRKQQWVRVTLAIDSLGSFSIHARPNKDDSDWTIHARGEVLTARTSCVPPSTDILSNCHQREISATDYYRWLSDIGLDYGVQFRGISRAKVGDKCAIGEFKFTPEVSADMSSYVLHPAVLDACIQLLLATLPGFDCGSARTLYLPVEIHELKLYRARARPAKAIASLTHATDRLIVGDLQIFGSDGDIIASLEGISGRAVGNVESQVHSILHNRLCEYQWKESAREAKSEAYLISPTAVRSDLLAHMSKLASHYARTYYYSDVEPALGRLSAHYICEALSKLGFNWKEDRCLTPRTLVELYRVQPKFDRLCLRILQILAHAEIFRHDEGAWKVFRLPETKHCTDVAAEVQSKFSEFELEIELLKQCGENLAGVLTGVTNPLDLIFPEGHLDCISAFYTKSPSFRIYNDILVYGLRKILENLNNGGLLRILEVGAGTGGLTFSVLPVMALLDAEYTFTDVAPTFLSAAQSRFAEHSFVGYKLLDIERSPVSQGFSLGVYDVVLASDVFHATKNLGAVLNNVKSLLKPGGLLAFVETTKPTEWVDLVFGLTDGWWRFEDEERLATQHPLIGADSWRARLAEQGFSDIVGLSDESPNGRELQTVFFSRRTVAPELGATTRSDCPMTWVILKDSGGLGERLAHTLESNTETVVRVTPGRQFRHHDGCSFEINVRSVTDYELVIETLPRDKPIVFIHGWSLDCPVTSSLSADHFAFVQSVVIGSALRLIQAIRTKGISGRARLCFVTERAGGDLEELDLRGVQQSPLWGFLRTVRAEYPGLPCLLIDLANAEQDSADLLLDEISNPNWLETEIAYNKLNQRFVHRLVSPQPHEYLTRGDTAVSVKANRSLALYTSQPGDLDKLAFREVDERPLDTNEVRIRVKAAGLNFKDVMLATGLLDDQALVNTYAGNALGMECAGLVVAVGSAVKEIVPGDEVIALVASAMSSFVIAPTEYVVRKPVEMTCAEAAGVLVSYLTVDYALLRLAQLQPGESVLIHSATGGVGLAALNIARLIGATIFATAGTEAKRNYLKSLGIVHVFDSRSFDFAEEIRHVTGGRGADVVLNSLSGGAIDKSLSVLAPYGRFVELGKTDIYQNNTVHLFPFRNNISYFAFDLDKVMRDRRDQIECSIKSIISRLQSGQLLGLPYRLFKASEAASAFRYMSHAKHIGKVVLAFSQDDHLPLRKPPAVSPRVDPHGTYWVTGGTSGFGLAVAEWLVAMGAKSLVLMSRRGVVDPLVREKLEIIREQGVQIVVSQGDVTELQDVASLAARIRSEMPPLRGIVHAAMVLDDELIPNLTEDHLARVFAPKACGAWNLHEATLADRLDFFLTFSSIVGLLGNAGQANYAAANVFLGTLAKYRLNRGLPALAVDWGAIGDVGFVARNRSIAHHLDRQGLKTMAVREALSALGAILANPYCAEMGVVNMDWQQWASTRSDALVARTYRQLIDSAQPIIDHENATGPALASQLSHAESEQARFDLIVDALAAQVAIILNTSKAKISSQEPLTLQGLDSLMAGQLSAWAEVEMGIDAPITDILKGVTINQLAMRLSAQYSSTHAGADEGYSALNQAVAEPFRRWVLKLADEMHTQFEEWKSEPVPEFADTTLREYTLPPRAEVFSRRLLRASTELAQQVAYLSPEQHANYRKFYRKHLLDLFLRSPLLERAYKKPLGYPGDFEMMNMIYARIPQGENLYDAAVDKYAKDESASRAVVGRIDYICDRLYKDVGDLGERTVRIANIGCGSARDLEDFLRRYPELGSRLDILLIDQDNEALRDARRRLTPLVSELGATLNCAREAVDKLLDPQISTALLGAPHIVYSTGLFDYLNDQTFRRLLSIMYGGLTKGGHLYVGNLAVNNPTRWFIEYATDWFVLHRTDDEMVRLGAQLDPKPDHMVVESEPLGINLFLTVTK